MQFPIFIVAFVETSLIVGIWETSFFEAFICTLYTIETEAFWTFVHNNIIRSFLQNGVEWTECIIFGTLSICCPDTSIGLITSNGNTIFIIVFLDTISGFGMINIVIWTFICYCMAEYTVANVVDVAEVGI